MLNYDFSTLNPIDFERLVCDLLNSKENDKEIKFRSFKEGKDKGIDLLYSTLEKDYHTVVQVKHYHKSSFSTLKRDLIKEADKVRLLNPTNYIFVTSLSLSVNNIEEIKKIFSPFIKTHNDILGRDDINNILGNNKIIEEKHFKLWFSSTTSINKLLQYKFFGRNNEFTENEIKKKLRLFVNTIELNIANEILNINKFLIITGEPGVGKTTLSEILIYKFLSRDYGLTIIYDDIKEIEATLANDDSKQIFYFDDFLGHTQAEIAKSKAAETSLLKIISRIEKLENKFLILNTRKFILTSFLEESERFRNFNPLKSESKIELKSYSYGAKRRMFDNHLSESTLTVEKIEVLRRFSHFICSHRNFTPRHLEFYTSFQYMDNLSNENLKDFVFENLEYPNKIWEHAYNYQISDYERFLLNTLFSLKDNNNIEVIELAYNSRLDFESKKYNYIKPMNSFNSCLKRLNDGFIVNLRYKNNIRIEFINPSLEDFLSYLIKNNNDELERILLSSINISQWYVFFSPYVDKNVFLSNKIIEFLSNSFINKTTFNIDKFKSTLLLIYYSKNNNLKSCLVLKSISNWDFILYDQDMAFYNLKFLKANIDKPIINYTISKLSNDYFLNTILSCEHLEDLYDIIFLFKNHYDFNFINKFDKNSLDYCCNKEVILEIYNECITLLNQEVDRSYNFLNTNIDVGAYQDVSEKLEEYIMFIKNQMFTEFDIDLSILKNKNWDEIAENNYSDFLTLDKTSSNYYEEEENIDVNYELNYDYDEDYYNYDEEKRSFYATEISLDDLPF